MEEFEQGIWRSDMMVASCHLGSLTRLGSLLVLPALWLHFQPTAVFVWQGSWKLLLSQSVCVNGGEMCEVVDCEVGGFGLGAPCGHGLAYLPTELLLQVCNGEVSAIWKQMYSWRRTQILQKDKQISWWRLKLIWATKLECSYDSI